MTLAVLQGKRLFINLWLLPLMLSLPVAGFVFRLLDVDALAFFYKATLVLAIGGIAYWVMPVRWRLVFAAAYLAYWFWAVMRFRPLGGSLASFLGAFAYASLLTVWLAPHVVLSRSLLLRYGLVALSVLLILGFLWGQSRFVEPWANPNTVALFVAALVFFVVEEKDHGWQTWLFLALAGILLAPLLSRSAMLVVDLVLLARLLRTRSSRERAAWLAVWLAFVAVTAYVFWARGDFIAQQVGDGGRVDIVNKAVATLSAETRLYFLTGYGFGTATNAFTNLKDHQPTVLPFVHAVPSFFGGLDNTFVAALVNGGLPLVLGVAVAFFGWLVRLRGAPWPAWIEAGCLATAMLVQLISLNMPEVWPPVFLWLLALWRWHPPVRTADGER